MPFLTVALFLSLSACQATELKHDAISRDYSSVRSSSSPADIPVEAFFRNPTVMSYRVSPDGKSLALLKSWKSRMNIFVHPVDSSTQQKQITFVEDQDLYHIYWKGPEHLLFTMDSGGDENDHVYVVNILTGQMKDLTPIKGVKAGVADDLEESSPDHVLITHNARNPETFDLYRVNILTGESQLVKQNDQNIDSWLIDHNGQVRGGTASDGVTKVLYYEKQKGKRWEAILKTDFRNNFQPIAFTADNRHLYVITNLNRDLDALVEVDPQLPESRFVLSTIFAHGKNDVSEAAYSEVHRNITRVTVVTDRRETRLLNREDQKDWNFLRKKLNVSGLALGNTSRDERFWVVKTLSDLSRGNYYLFDRNKKQITDLGNLSPWLEPEQMSEMKSVSYVSRDGLKIPAYLTLPKGLSAKNLPVVVNVHGGPWARDEWGFDSEVQFLASRGYAVLQINYRGSTGYGRKFWESSFKQWGRKMQNDISDGVEWLKSQGVADPQRVCIYGGSYGGYAALAGITLTPELYACGVDYVGISNMFTFLNSIPPYWKSYSDMLHAMVGHPEKDREMLKTVSPVFHVDRIRAPLFVAQGANDPRVKKAESDQIVAALRQRGVDVEYMVKDNEGHGFSNEENRFDFYRAMEKFLAKHLGGRK